jgi:S-adenosylmethionine hydrolase
MISTVSSPRSRPPRVSVARVFITFLSDFGLQDDFVGTCHGVMKRIAPEVEIIDITHGIRPQEVLQGALVLANTLPYMPPGVHLAVVDPGVGGSRRPLALRDAEGRLYVGPDNGLLQPACDRFGGVEAAHELANPEYALQPVSRTFHGRDLFAPAAAHLARGVALDDLGPPIAVDALVRLEPPAPIVSGSEIAATVVYVDHFGNAQLNLTREHLEQAGVQPGRRLEIELEGGRHEIVAARTFDEAPAGGAILYENSYRTMSLAVSRGSAAERYGARPGALVRIHVGSA